MKWIKLILFLVVLCLICSIGYGQGVTNFGATRPQDTGLTKGQLKFTAYTNSDATKFLTVDATGRVVFAVPSGGGGGVTLSQMNDSLAKKQDTITLTTTGSSGPATLVGSVLNIPEYSAGTTYTAGNRLLLSGGAFMLDTFSLFDYNFNSPTNFKLPTTAAVNAEINTAINNKHITIGDTVIGSESGWILYTNAGKKLAQDEHFVFSSDILYAPRIKAQHTLGSAIDLAPDDTAIIYNDGTRFYYTIWPRLNNQVGDIYMYFPLRDNQDTFATNGWVREQGFATTDALADSVSVRQKDSDTTTWDATKADLALKVNYSDSGTVYYTTYGIDTAKLRLTTAIATKQPTGNYITALTGDVTASGPGSVAATLATVNSNVGTFGSATAIPQITYNGKGLATAVTTVQPEVVASNTVTLTHKRWVPRVISAASYSVSVTINGDNTDLFEITAQAGALLFNAPSGTPNNGDVLQIRIKDNGTARALTYNAIFNWSPPSTTVLGKWMNMFFQWNSTTSNWNFMHKRDEP